MRENRGEVETPMSLEKAAPIRKDPGELRVKKSRKLSPRSLFLKDIPTEIPKSIESDYCGSTKERRSQDV